MVQKILNFKVLNHFLSLKQTQKKTPKRFSLGFVLALETDGRGPSHAGATSVRGRPTASLTGAVPRPARERAVTTDDSDHRSGDEAREGMGYRAHSTRRTTESQKPAAPRPIGRRSDADVGDR